jgi:hypothetical protein
LLNSAQNLKQKNVAVISNHEWRAIGKSYVGVNSTGILILLETV